MSRLGEDITGGMVIAIEEARDACKGEPDVEERLRKAMRKTHNHWMETDPTRQIKSAVAAAMLETLGELEKARIAASWRRLSRFNAAIGALQAGVDVDLEKLLDDMPEDNIPILKLWHELTARRPEIAVAKPSESP